VQAAVVVGGRVIDGSVLARLSATVEQEPACTRSELSRRLCDWIEWRGANGRRCEVGARKALIALERRGVLKLPAVQRRIAVAPRRMTPDATASPPCIVGTVHEIDTLELVPVSRRTPELSAVWRDLLAVHHPLGSGPLVGAQLRYLIGSERGWLGALSFSAAAWRLAPRDGWIGWSAAAHRAHLPRVVCNSRFLIAPWVHLEHLASKCLALALRRLPADWEAAYGYRPLLVETYVDPSFRGTSYRASNWIAVGPTRGRGRQDRAHACAQTIKEVYLYPLRRDARTRLCREPVGAPIAPVAVTRPRPSRGADWAEEEFGDAPLDHARRQKRLLTMARDFYARPQANVPQACGSRAKTKAAYRWLDCRDVTLSKVLAPHLAATARRVAEHRVVLAVQDTTSFNYTTHRHMQGLGPIGTTLDGPRGVLMHDTMAYTPTGVPLGLVDVQVWARDPSEHGQSARSERRPIESKESRKWLRSFEAASALQEACPDTTIVSVGDREADVYELFLAAQQRARGPKLLVRAVYGRKLTEESFDVWQVLGVLDSAGTQVVRVPRRGSRPAREAALEVRFAPVTLRAPTTRPKLAPVQVWAVLAREMNPPAGEDGLEWRLYTTVEVASFAAAVEVLGWYTQRWQIEVYHRTLKSGCRIEERQLGTETRWENCLAIDLVVAWRIVHLTKLGREQASLPCTVYFQDHEWKALYCFIARRPDPPAEVPSLRDAMRAVASLGGFLGRAGDGEPGAKALWIGLQRLDDIAMAWLAFSPYASAPLTVPSYLDSG
jgi:hypothetical protein